MGYLPAFIHPDRVDSPEVRHYQKLLAYSVDARTRGDHWTAQRLASAAHKWAMSEMTRLQHLKHESEILEAATKRLEAAWDHDRSCATLAELQERHPEYRRLAVAWEAAEQRVRDLSTPIPPDESVLISAIADVPEARRARFRPVSARRASAQGASTDASSSRDG